MNMLAELLHSLRMRAHQVDCQLGPVKLRLQVPHAGSPALHYFADTRHFDTVDHELFVVDDEPWLTRTMTHLQGHADKTLRARRFSKGHYLLHHHGRPTLKLSADAGRTHLVAGPTASTAVWAYYLKYFASHHGLRHGAVHLKAAAVADRNGDVTLIIGRSAGGKSVLMHQLVSRGMRFVSNTHVLVSGDTVQGMLTAIRVRRGSVFDHYVDRLPVRHHEESGELLLKPQDLFGDRITASGPVRNILVAHYGSPTPGIRPLSPVQVEAMLTQFAQGLNVYGLKDDLLELVDDDVQAFSAVCQNEARALATLSTSCRAFLCDINAADEHRVDALLHDLAAAH